MYRHTKILFLGLALCTQLAFTGTEVFAQACPGNAPTIKCLSGNVVCRNGQYACSTPCTGSAQSTTCPKGETATCNDGIWQCPSQIRGSGAQLQNPLGNDFGKIISDIIRMIIGISGSVALLMFIYGGFLWLTSMGNEDRVDHGKEVFKWATIGLVVIFTSYVVLSQILKILS